MSEERWIVIPKWDQFQHYKDRDPKWIKNYNSLLSDDIYLDLTGHQRAVLHGLWLSYAASNRELRSNTASLSRRLNLKVTSRDLDALISRGLVSEGKHPAKSGANNWASRYVSDETRTEVLERDGNKCCICGSSEDLEIDHILPISKGGDGSIGNLQTLCRSHNRRKHNQESVSDLSSKSPQSVHPEKSKSNKDLSRARKSESKPKSEWRPWDAPRAPADTVRTMVNLGVITDRVTLDAELRALRIPEVDAESLRALLPSEEAA
jgi:hypothetical protein